MLAEACCTMWSRHYFPWVALWLAWSPNPFDGQMGTLSTLWLNLLAEISKGIKGSRGEIKWTMAYYNHLSIDAFFLIFVTKWGSAKQNAVLSIICQPKLFSGHWIWVTPHIPLSSQVQSFHCRLVHLQSNSTKLQPWQQWTGANILHCKVNCCSDAKISLATGSKCVYLLSIFLLNAHWSL